MAILIIDLVIILAGLWLIAVLVYGNTFNKRFESSTAVMRRAAGSELSRTKYEFASNNGQALTGYLYSALGDQRAIVVLAHGIGNGGHAAYIECAEHFAKSGFYVFGFDATGNDESGGNGVGGLPQGVIDLDRAISFIEESGDIPELPIVLFGHSWGAYSACSVLEYHPEVKAVIACSGFNRSSDMFEAEGKRQAGIFIHPLMPFIRLHERIKFGKYAAASAMNGFAASEAAVMIVHSADDETVPMECGYDLYYEKYCDDPRFEFIRFEGRGHNGIYYDGASGSDSSYRFDTELFDRFVSFYDESLSR